MESKRLKISYTALVILHIMIGVLVYFIPFISKIYAFLILIVGVVITFKNKNENNEVLYVAAYLTGVEVFLRMTEGNFIEQFSKFGVIGFLLLGIMFKGVSRPAIPYYIFLLLLVPGIFIGAYNLDYETDARKAITFNSIGPITLAFSSIYCFKRQITLKEIVNILHSLSLPIICIVVYLFLYTPSVKEVVFNTQSNFATSGGFGPNQMSTILGLGIFVFFAKILLFSESKSAKIIDVIFLLLITFRGIVTFSRGGVIAGGAMVVLLLVLTFRLVGPSSKWKLVRLFIFGIVAFIGIWAYSSAQTNGLIDKRYANKDAKGRVKESKLTGREKLIESEFNMFLDNPIFGIGVGKNKEYREQTIGIEAASHNEITRMLAEHGSLGIIGLLILLVTPVVYSNRMNVFVVPFIVFWILTINHAAMRLAAPAFVYALSLLKVYAIEKSPLHRESTLE